MASGVSAAAAAEREESRSYLEPTFFDFCNNSNIIQLLFNVQVRITCRNYIYGVCIIIDATSYFGSSVFEAQDQTRDFILRVDGAI